MRATIGYMDDNGCRMLRRMLDGYVDTQLLYVMAKLGVADALHAAPRTAADLADAVGADPDALTRLPRALAARGGVVAAGAGAMLDGNAITAMAGTLAAPVGQPRQGAGPTMNFVLSHEQFPVPSLLRFGTEAQRAGFDGIWTSDHFQPWQPNEGHSGQAWVTLAALGQHAPTLRMGTGVTCPIFRYRPAVVAEAFASLSLLSPGRIFLGVGTGEKLNEAAAGGGWGLYRERAARLVEAIGIMRALWTGRHINYQGRFWQVNARLYDPPVGRIPIYVAAGGPKSARLAGMYGDGLIADPAQLRTNPAYKDAFIAGARAVGKNPNTMPIMLEHFVSVSDMQTALADAELWRFTAKAWKPGFFNNESPVAIQRNAEQQIPREVVANSWVVSTDPAAHLLGIQQLVNLGVTDVFVHSAQADQVSVINFFGQQVLPQVRAGAIQGVRAVNRT